MKTTWGVEGRETGPIAMFRAERDARAFAALKMHHDSDDTFWVTRCDWEGIPAQCSAHLVRADD